MAETKNTKAFYNTDIPSDWEVRKLEEIFEITAGGDIEKEFVRDERDDEFKYPVFANAGKNKGIYGYSNKYKVDFNCVTLSGRGEIGIANARFEKFYPIVRLLVLKPKQKMDLVFIENYLNKLNIHQESTGVPQLTAPQISKYRITLPPLPEQKAIAQVLSTADAAIHTTEKLIAQKELRKKWLMQQLLTGKKRLKGFGGEWKEKHLGDMFIERNETKYFDLPLLSIGQNGVYPQDESVKKDTSNDDKSKYKRICPGDIGYNTMRMWQGRSALSELEGIVSPAYTVVTPKKNADSVFFSYLFKLPKMTNLFWRNSQGLVDDTLNCKFKDFSIVKVMLPQTKEEQIAIAQVLQAADKEISLLKAKAEKLREQKKGLMQVLLMGKKRLKFQE